MASFEDQIGPVARGKRSAVLLDGKAHARVVKALTLNRVQQLVQSLPTGLQLVKAERQDSWGAEDASYFVVNVAMFLERSKRGCVDDSVIICDVSADNKPSVASPSSRPDLYTGLNEAIAYARGQFSEPEKQGDIINILPPGGLNSLVLGWILEYPCVYYSSSMESNALSDEPLLLVSLLEPDASERFTSFSVPLCLIHDNENIRARLAIAKEKLNSRGLLWNEEIVCLPRVSL